MSSIPKNIQAMVRPKQKYQVSSLSEECLMNLRNGRSKKQSKTHLLGFMSEYMQDEQKIKIQQIDQLCCYDRMKKFLIKNHDTKQQRKIQEVTLSKAIQIQAKMNQLEKELKSSLNLNKSQTLYNPNKINLTPTQKNTKFTKKNSTETIQSQDLISSSMQSKNKHNLMLKSTLIDDLKSKGYEKFFQLQKIKKQNNVNKIKSIIGEQIQSKFKKVINQKDLFYRKLNQENKGLEKKILQKNVEMETLRSENQYLKEYIKQLQEKLFGVSNELQNAHLIASYEKWLAQYKQAFGQISINQLKDYVQSIKEKCLEKFNVLENKNCEKIEELNKVNDGKLMRLKKEIQKLEKRENELVQINKNIKLNRQISEMQINELINSKQQLKSLQSIILSLYSQWYSQRTENQKTLLKQFDKLKDNYSYAEMLQYIVFYKQKLSTNDKLSEYILKVLRGIQKIRRLIFPLQSNDKLDPFLVMDKIEHWVNKRLSQEKSNQPNNNTNVNHNMSSSQSTNMFITQSHNKSSSGHVNNRKKKPSQQIYDNNKQNQINEYLSF